MYKDCFIIFIIITIIILFVLFCCNSSFDSLSKEQQRKIENENFNRKVLKVDYDLKKKELEDLKNDNAHKKKEYEKIYSKYQDEKNSNENNSKEISKLNYLLKKCKKNLEKSERELCFCREELEKIKKSLEKCNGKLQECNEELQECNEELDRRKKCCYDSLVKDSDKYIVVLSFWEKSNVDPNNPVIPATPPVVSETFSWNDPERCFTWNREVKGQSELRLNVISDMVLVNEGTEQDPVWVFTFLQNDKKCCSEFNTPGTEKTFCSNVVTEDPSTGQQGDPLWAAVTSVTLN